MPEIKSALVPVLETILGNFWKLDDRDEATVATDRFVELTALKDYLEEKINEMKPGFISSDVHAVLYDHGVRVDHTLGAAKTELDSTIVFDSLLSQDRLNDFVRIAKISQTDLLKLENQPNQDTMEVIVAKAKVTLGANADSVKVSALTKDDKAAMKSLEYVPQLRKVTPSELKELLYPGFREEFGDDSEQR